MRDPDDFESGSKPFFTGGLGDDEKPSKTLAEEIKRADSVLDDLEQTIPPISLYAQAD